MSISDDAVEHIAENFDYHDPAVTDPHPIYAKLRECPVTKNPLYGGHWLISGYDEAYAALMDSDTFSSSIVSIPADYAGRPLIPEQLDDPEHKLYKRLLIPAFSATPMERLEPVVRERCRNMIAAFPEDGPVEFVEAFATPFPVSIFLDLLGVPQTLLPDFVRYHKTIVHTFHEEDADVKRFAAVQAVHGVFLELMAERMREPKDDLISYICTVQLEGRDLTEEERLDIAFTMFIAGLDTTSGALGFSFLHLAQNPELQQYIREHEEEIPAAVEELLRFNSPISTARLAMKDIDFFGCPIKKGDPVLILTASANRDEKAFDNPDEVRIGRTPNRHVGFGVGIHRCLGINLARLQLRVAFEEIHRAFSSYEVADPDQLRWRASGVRGVDRMPLNMLRSVTGEQAGA